MVIGDIGTGIEGGSLLIFSHLRLPVLAVSQNFSGKVELLETAD